MLIIWSLKQDWNQELISKGGRGEDNHPFEVSVEDLFSGTKVVSDMECFYPIITLRSLSACKMDRRLITFGARRVFTHENYENVSHKVKTMNNSVPVIICGWSLNAAALKAYAAGWFKKPTEKKNVDGKDV